MNCINAYLIEPILPDRKSDNESSLFISRCVNNLISGGGGANFLNYDYEFCFDEKDAIEIVERVKSTTCYKKGKHTCTYRYDQDNDMYIIEIRKKGRPDKRMIKRIEQMERGL